MDEPKQELEPRCGCGEPVMVVNGVLVHCRRRLDRHHVAELQLSAEDLGWTLN